MKKYLVLFLSVALSAPLFAQKDATERLEASAEVLREIMQTPDKGIPQELFSNAECVIVIPNMKKGGFIIGAKYGRGFFRAVSGQVWAGPRPARSKQRVEALDS